MRVANVCLPATGWWMSRTRSWASAAWGRAASSPTGRAIDEGDPLFLQIKQANTSLLEPYLGRSEYAQPGHRVVTGQRLMQATNDIFLGYAHSGEHDYFVRQLYDMKGSADLSRMTPTHLKNYAALCGAVLARAHARTGDAAQIAGYLGKGDRFDTALVEFAVRYADQNDADYALFREAIADGRIEAAREETADAVKNGNDRR